MRQWRLITDKPTLGAHNMAVDEAILTAVSAGDALPTLRLYAWSPFCLSLGYGQRASDADIDRLHARGWTLVRRPTGGRAILHGDELTYSVTLPADHELAQGDVVASYRRISEALIMALQIVGLAPESEKQPKGNRSVGAVCFEVPSHYEITSGGRKLIGSAQLRRKTGILQHGTLPLYGDIARICEALSYPDEAARSAAVELVRERATTLADVCGTPLTWYEAADALISGFERAFDVTFTEGILSEAEHIHAGKLLDEVYLRDEWTYKR